MSMDFEELDGTTRQYMMQEFECEITGDNPYYSKALSSRGREVFPELMKQAIEEGTEQTLETALDRPEFWNPTESYVRKGIPRERRVNVRQAAQRLALTEFNTWYVRGLAKRLMDEGVTHCQVYRAADPKWQPSECSEHEDKIFSVSRVYDGHRAKYWRTANSDAVSIPFGPGCHHTIRRTA
ncbi:hypothetical protein [Candidatus Palauibacter sp.]|uniref:hypothetical protein n=1 Tax=Candidatus Palauibacter sp. TaxID=3101350 RepID=UPI003B01D905